VLIQRLLLAGVVLSRADELVVHEVVYHLVLAILYQDIHYFRVLGRNNLLFRLVVVSLAINALLMAYVYFC
jgi:hypothetical protein